MKHKAIPLAIPCLLATLTLLGTPAQAVEGLSANVGFTSNYLWRGVSQTDDSAAISGGLDYAAENGFYAGTWVSNVDFSDDASYELDFYLGFGGDINENISYDLGYIYYAYPDSAESDKDNEYDFGEIYAGITFSNITLAANYGVHNDDGAGWADKALYISADAEFEVAEGLTLNLHLGDYSFDDDYDSGDYTDYGISLSKSGFTLALTDTDLDNDDVKFTVSYAIGLDL
ncbi:TorF family putative porin [Thalassomonas haliotis]|uniref:Histidine kinase n=1 Tax=Thalassomonas haliotis TaxID=485448 RepID=A0ABY7VHI1_9GAMM|nr:TorF family putative porin [Thalassomonas haliotis]WDE12505.1 hypothetical protein H3N35_03200 [Thalassomonas haliotis]